MRPHATTKGPTGSSHLDGVRAGRREVSSAPVHPQAGSNCGPGERSPRRVGLPWRQHERTASLAARTTWAERRPPRFAAATTMVRGPTTLRRRRLSSPGGVPPVALGAGDSADRAGSECGRLSGSLCREQLPSFARGGGNRRDALPARGDDDRGVRPAARGVLPPPRLLVLRRRAASRRTRTRGWSIGSSSNATRSSRRSGPAARRKKQGLANVQYLRFDRFFLLLATYGEHRFFERGGQVDPGCEDGSRSPSPATR